MRDSYLYTLIFVFDQEDVLLVKRSKEPWKNLFNGLGGKRENGELPNDCIIRELEEESGIVINYDDLIDCGIVTWNDENLYENGLHVYKTHYKLDSFKNNINTKEGLLVLKNKQFLLDKTNNLIATNIPYFFNFIVNGVYSRHHCVFNQNELISVTKIESRN